MERGRRQPPLQGLLSLIFGQFSEPDLDRSLWLYFLVSPVIDGLEVHGGRVVLAALLGNMSEAVRQNIRRQLADTELADLLPAQRKPGQVSLVGLTDEPVLLQSTSVHSFAVIEDGNRRLLIVKIRRQENANPPSPRVERVGDQLLDSLIWAGVQSLGEQTHDPVTQPDVDLLGFTARGRIDWIVCHELNRLLPKPARL